MKQAACMLVIDKKNNVILGVTRKHTTLFGLPGGKLEKNETPQEAAIRECFEETGCLVTKCSHIFSRESPGKYNTSTFLAEEYEFPYGLQEEEYSTTAWISPTQLLNGAYPQYNKDLLKKVGIISSS